MFTEGYVYSFYFIIIFKFLPEDMFLLIFRSEEGGETWGGGEKERGREREKCRCERKTLIRCLPYVPQLELEPST